MANESAKTFDIETQQIAKVYAKAFMGAAASVGQVDKLVAELDSLVKDVIGRFPELEKLLSSSFVAHEDKVGLLDRTLGKQASTTLMAFLKVLSQHGRLGALRAVRDEVLHLHAKLRGEVEVLVRAAFPLDQALSQSIADSLRKLLKQEPKLTIETDPALLGGVVVRVGDTVYDGSVATQLEQLRSRIIHRTVDEIETRRERFLTDGAASA